MLATMRDEALLWVAALAVVIGYGLEHWLLGGRTIALVAAAGLMVAIICAAMRVAHHAEVLAEKVGDPYGTMILTLSAVLVEVIILVIMMSHDHSPTLARDTIYSAVMLDINGIVGLTALLGGIKHGEQPYNDDSGKVYGVMIITAVGISMLVPEFLPDDKWPLYSGFTIIAMALLYSLFLRMQTGPHSYFFSYHYPEKKKRGAQARVAAGAVASTAAVTAGGTGGSALSSPAPHPDAGQAAGAGSANRGGTAASESTGAGLASGGHEASGSAILSIVCLVIGVALTGALAEVMSQAFTVGTEGLTLPPIFIALVVAIISASPEILTALRAAMANRMQSVINIALGASLSTVILTIPVVEAIALFTGNRIDMALTPVQTVMMAITLIVASINLNDGETNAIEGMTHFVLFATFIMLSVIGL